jgi:hypothetical protein
MRVGQDQRAQPYCPSGYSSAVYGTDYSLSSGKERGDRLFADHSAMPAEPTTKSTSPIGDPSGPCR